MELESVRKKLELNPELEALRIKGLKENTSETDDWILRLISRTRKIHAGFLFEDPQTLQNLCLLIGETQNKVTDPGWEAFGYHLGLRPSVLKVINHNNFNKEDPCYNVLLAYIQHENAAIGKIIEALYKMGRIDVLSRMQQSFNDLADIILHCNVNNVSCQLLEDTSDYESLTSNEGNSCSSNGGSSSNSNFSNTGVIGDIFLKPKIIPPAPFIFKNIQASREFTFQRIQEVVSNILLNTVSNLTENKSRHVENQYEEKTCHNFCEFHKGELRTECIKNQSLINRDKKNFTKSKKNYGLKILITFAEDGEKYVAEVCKVFRRRRENFPQIGVLVLSEHADTVNKDPQQFISGAFSQVNFVCPILTRGYFNLIMKKQKASFISNMHIDAFYAPYVFRLMNSYFVSNDCLNDKIRSIIPETEFTSIPFKYLWTNPIFGAWVKLCEVDELAVRLLKSETRIV